MAGDGWNGSAETLCLGSLFHWHLPQLECPMSKMTTSLACLLSGLTFGVDCTLLFPLHMISLGFLIIWWSSDTQPSYVIADFPQIKSSKRPRQKLQGLLEPSFGSHASLPVHSISYAGPAHIHCGMRQLKIMDTRK